MPFPSGPYSVDTSILLRLDQLTAPARPAVIATLNGLTGSGKLVYITPQNLTEFWNVATRPLVNNGLGMAPAQAAVRVRSLQQQFNLLPDSADVYPEWERLAETSQVSGKQVHDTRRVAFMLVDRRGVVGSFEHPLQERCVQTRCHSMHGKTPSSSRSARRAGLGAIKRRKVSSSSSSLYRATFARTWPAVRRKQKVESY